MWLVLVTSVLVIVAYAMFSMVQIGNGLMAISGQDLPLAHAISNIANKQLEQSISLERAIRHGETIAISEDVSESEQFYKESIENFEKYSVIIGNGFVSTESLIKSAMSGVSDEDEREKFNQLEQLTSGIKSSHKEYEKTAEEIFQALKFSKLDEAASFYGEITRNTDKLKHEFEDILSELEKYSQQETLSARRYEKNAFIMLGIITVISLIVSTPFAWWVILKISRGMRKAVNVAEKIAQGDLTYIEENRDCDEIGQLLDELAAMHQNLRNMISKISESTNNLESSAQEVFSACERSNENIKLQQTEISLVATAMNEMSTTVNEVAKNAEETAASASTSNTDARHGNEVVNITINSINQLEQDVGQAATTIQKVGEDTESVSTILDVIKEIAEQTNLLALNAAIEAARAGEQGRGFAVVADEVRVLAQRTQESTLQIESMITQLQTGAKNAVDAMHAGQGTVLKSVEQAEEAGAALQKITQAVQNITDMNTHIASASVEQASVAEEMNQNLTRAHDLSDENAELIQQTFTHSQELSGMASDLKNLMQQFKL